MKRTSCALWLLCLLSVSTAAQDPPVGQDSNPAADQAEQAFQQIETRIRSSRTALGDAGLNEADAKAAGQILDKAAADVVKAREQHQSAQNSRTQSAAFAAEVKKLGAPPEVAHEDDVVGLEQSALDARLARLQIDVTESEQKLKSLTEAATSPASGRQEIQEQLTALETSQSELQRQLEELPVDNPTARNRAARLGIQAQLVRLAADREVLLATQARIETELKLNLPSLRREWQQKLVAAQQDELRLLSEEAERRRQVESERQLKEAREANLAALSSSKLRELARRREELAQENQELVKSEIPRYEEKLARASSLNERISLERKKIEERIRRFGATGTVGRDLLYFRNRFPQPDDLRDRMKEIDGRLSEIRQLQLDYSDEQQQVRDLKARDAELLKPADLKVIDGHLTLLSTLADNSLRLSTLLSDLDSESRRTLKEMATWAEYESEHALWFRSHLALRPSDLKQLSPQAAAASERLVNSIKAAIGQRAGIYTGLAAVTFVMFVILLVIQRKARAVLHEVAEDARRSTCESMAPTIRAVLMTIVDASEWPIFCVVLGNLCLLGGARGAGTALVNLAGVMLWMNFLRLAVRVDGLAEAHFQLHESVCRRLNRWSTFLAVLTLPGLFCLMFVRLTGRGDDILERFLFVTLMLAICAVAIRLLFPRRNAIVSSICGVSDFVRRLRWLWTTVPIALPLVLAGLSIAGFHYTGFQLAVRGGIMIVLLSVVALFYQLLMRWLQVSATHTRLQFARERAEELRKQMEAKGESKEPSSKAAGISTPDTDESEIELFGVQARSMVRSAALLTAVACVWAIWADVLPALKLLDREPLWYVTEDTVVEAEVDGELSTVRETVRRPITVGNLLFGVFALTLTIIGVRQLPGLLEVILHSQSAIEAGVRYAICTVTRYLVLIVGTLFVCHSIGLHWGQVQWLAAGLSVGLGFGLQEVFANFISGLIMLVERPVRIGDVVTIDGISGVVTRIRIRATSITDWDRREYIVPNREFVTGKLLNWTLSDTTNRVVINVGISYGADPEQARAIMLEVANDHSEVLEDPGPVATFENFGDSSLDLVLRAYLPDLDNRLGTITQLHTEINRRFGEAGIEIPFPQRDLHIYQQPPAA